MFRVNGYGTTGDPVNGETNDIDGKQRSGLNRFDASGSVVGFSDDTLVYDFDDGTTQDDALGSLFGIRDLGEGVNEVGINHGDSGGPEFIDGKIAGVNDFGLIGYPGTQNINPDPNAFGGVGSIEGGVRVPRTPTGSTSSP